MTRLKIFWGQKSQKNNLSSFLARAVAGTIGIRIGNAILGYGISLILAHFLGAAGYGIYSYVIAWINLLEIPAMLGLSSLLVRELAIYQTQGNWGLAKGLLRWSNQIVFIASIIIAIVATSIAWQLLPAMQLQTFWIAAIVLPLTTLSRIRQAVMQAFRRIVTGQLPEVIIRPCLLILLLGVSYFLVDSNMTASWAMLMYVIATAIAFVIGCFFLQRSVPEKINQATSAYQIGNWITNTLPMLFIGGMYIINNQTDTVMLGSIRDSAEVGIYTIANRGAGLITFILVAFNMSLGPTFASLYAAGEKQKLQRLVTTSCRTVFFAALPIALVLIIFGQWFLLLFGSEFIAGQTTLTILCLGQLSNAFTGSVAVLLNMTGHQNDTAIGVTISAFLNIILNSILIPQWGTEGAAIATASSTLLWNLLLVFLVYKRLKIYASAVGKLNL